MFFTIKVLISALIIVLISEVSKRSEVLGAILASVPLVSVLGILWFRLGGAALPEVALLSRGIFWMVLPSLLFFLSLPLLIKRGFGFYPSMAISLVVMVVAYFIMLLILKKFGIKV